MNYLGDFTLGDTVYVYFDSVNQAGASSDFSVNPSFRCYEDGSGAQITAGITGDDTFDLVTGIYKVEIDTSAAGYEAHKDYALVATGGTLDSQTINAVLATFSIENRGNEDVRLGSVTNSPGGATDFRDSTLPSGWADDAIIGSAVVFTMGNNKGIARKVTGYTASTRELAFATPFPATIVTNDRYKIIGIIE